MLTRVSNVLRRTRSFQFVVYVANPRRATVWAGEGGALRVPPDRYRAALGRLIADIRNAGAVPLVITAPRAERVTSLLVRNGQATSVEEAIRLHDEYAEITREVAREAGAPLLDLAERFRAPAAAPLFADDGIHFKDAGRVRIAEAIYAAVQEIVRSPAWQARH
jgi:lysophospholipase L1-like esterase